MYNIIYRNNVRPVIPTYIVLSKQTEWKKIFPTIIPTMCWGSVYSWNHTDEICIRKTSFPHNHQRSYSRNISAYGNFINNNCDYKNKWIIMLKMPLTSRLLLFTFLYQKSIFNTFIKTKKKNIFEVNIQYLLFVIIIVPIYSI